jgi:hypothetical protein
VGQRTEELSTQIAGTRADLAQDLDALQDRVSPHAVMERRKAAARGSMHRMRSRVMGTAEDAKHSAGSTASQAMGTAEEKYEGSPLGAGLIAFGAGMLVSALIPASDTETGAARQVVDAAKEHGQPVMDEARSVGQDMGEGLKQSATEAAQGVKHTAAQSAEHVKQEGQTSAHQVQAEAKHQM